MSSAWSLPMNQLHLRPFNRHAYAILSSWFQDLELRRRVCPPTEQWYEYVHGPQCRAWMVFENRKAVGHVAVDIEADHTAHLLFLVKPALHGQGYGKRILRALIEAAPGEGIHRLRASVEADNLASIACLLAVGFQAVRVQPDNEGFLHFCYEIHLNRPSDEMKGS